MVIDKLARSTFKLSEVHRYMIQSGLSDFSIIKSIRFISSIEFVLAPILMKQPRVELAPLKSLLVSFLYRLPKMLSPQKRDR